MNITKDIKNVGVSDKQIDLFEGQYVVPNGMAYNSHVILDEKIAVLDTVDVRFGDQWLQNIKNVLNGRTPDYLIVEHMEPDHSANIGKFVAEFPMATVVGNCKTFCYMQNFLGDQMPTNTLTVDESTVLSLGKHNLQFVFAPMVHWPEVMMVYDSTDKVLFSADAFGKFGAADANEPWLDEARRYYIGIVGKYGVQVASLFKKIAALDVQIICPLHGVALTDNLPYYLGLYQTWATYGVESDGVLVAYTSVYGHTKQAALLLAEELGKLGVAVHTYDLARSDMSQVVAEAFRYGKVALATTTYNMEIFPFMRDFITHLVERNWQNRIVGIIENGSWAPMANNVMRKMLANCKNVTFAENTVTIKSALTDANRQTIAALAQELAK